MKKIWLGLACVVLAAVVAGFLARKHAIQLDTAHREYQNALETYYHSRSLLYGDRVTDAVKQLAALRVVIEAHKNDPVWENLYLYAIQLEGLSSYVKAQEQWIQFVRIYTTQSKEAFPNAKDITALYQEFEGSYGRLLGKPGFNEPSVSWRLENDIATSLVWQLVTRWAMEKAEFDQLKPLYDAALVHYKKAMAHAEKSGRSEEDFESPARYVSQNLDFMTRLGEAMEQQQQQQSEQEPQEGDQEGAEQGPQRKGLGDFLSRAMAQAQKGQGQPQGLGKMLSQGPPGPNQLFLPLPMKGIGASRLPSAGTR